MSSTTPNTTSIAAPGSLVATLAPMIAPDVVATSRKIPTRMFVKPSLRYEAAAPDEVAMTETNEAPIA